MNNSEQYRQIIKTIITNYIGIPQTYKKELEHPCNPSFYSCITPHAIISKNFYFVIVYGCDIPQTNGNSTSFKLIKNCIVHLEIDNEIIKIYQDKLEDSITDELIETGIPKDKIVILHPDKRDCVKYVVNVKKIYDRYRDYFTSDSNYKNPVLKTNLTSAELKELKKIDLVLINKAISQHPNTTPDLLKKLFKDSTVEVLSNPIMNLLLLEKPQFLEQLFDNDPYIFNRDNLELPDYFREWAVNNEREDIRTVIASSNKKSISYLKKLINDSSCLVIQNLCSNSNLPPDMEKGRW